MTESLAQRNARALSDALGRVGTYLRNGWDADTHNTADLLLRCEQVRADRMQEEFFEPSRLTMVWQVNLVQAFYRKTRPDWDEVMDWSSVHPLSKVAEERRVAEQQHRDHVEVTQSTAAELLAEREGNRLMRNRMEEVERNRLAIQMSDAEASIIRALTEFVGPGQQPITAKLLVKSLWLSEDSKPADRKDFEAAIVGDFHIPYTTMMRLMEKLSEALDERE